MKKSLESQQKNDVELYLQPGLQTLITPEVQDMALSFRGNTIEKVQQVLDKVKILSLVKFSEDVFRKRTGGQIIKDGYVTGCTDLALAFVTLARASGISAKYVETIDKSWLETGGNSIQGHIYSQIFDDEQNKWIWVDPMGDKVDTPPNRC